MDIARKHVFPSAAARPGFWRRFLPVWLAGVVGVLALLGQQPPEALFDHAPELRELPALALRALLLLNPLVLVTVFAAVGAALAHRVALGSALAGTIQLRPGLWVAAVWGVLTGVALAGLDLLWSPYLGAQWLALQEQFKSAAIGPGLLMGLLYGGLSEEILMRWGVTASLVWALSRLPRQTDPRTLPKTWTYVVAMVVAGLLFGLGHLPALSQQVDLTTALVVRTVTLNLLASLVYGWLFWRSGLEAAMLAHAGSHVGLTLMRLAIAA